MFRRLKRTRLKAPMRELVRETRLHKQDFIYPLFVIEGQNVKNEIPSMPDVFQLSVDNILKECEELLNIGIYHILLFGLPSHKDSCGSEALSDKSIIPQAIKAIKKHFPQMIITLDLCFCEYTDHGHCGILDKNLNSVDNDATLEILGQQALVLASCGGDMIAPSAMMDGMVSTIRTYLDKGGFSHIPIMSYSTKFASGYYGPFRDVANSAPSFGDRNSYQQDSANRREAILESLTDEAEGADILMVKPALAYLDIVRDIRDRTLLPLAVYNVSGEYAMLKHVQKANLIDYERVLFETLTGFKRAGADIIISYHTKEIAKLL
ncbi:porphobilinogen synthase [Helicobacter cinaedi]|uniref:Delta-aminolevulinic acid dehydratase n=1 Tax=Helicobacter cinaedi CCUG 18818 = ATCC BAA-847 TaxID=537971 RepID=A0AAI8QH67_9HELI|nr:porphobilinogen synthase [Helicobacter cinaedi]EFR47031.1 porphobilinogen synthase [Helicobacter cinaedi CCUG 18818 = ATCC BAA-847]QOQ91482.1 porphobilinogen synthase [Helicobacter cinaedi]BAM32490.1 delta-aminolevulinic acid dehydratase [Helicobacter cinaedi CCUG 18818 = ATCC BAA-847]